MENLSHQHQYQYYNPLHFDSSSDLSSPRTAYSSSSTSSDASSINVRRANNASDEEVILASSNPKKRAGRKKFRETRHPVYRGVRKRNFGKWVCEVRQPNNKSRRIWLGTYSTADMAARAHDVAAIALRGRSACLNFADSTWRLPIPASKDVKDIQRAAAEAAETFRPSSDDDDDDNGVKVAESATSWSPENDKFYTDDVAVFGMQELIANMAEGLMLPPPQCADDDVEISAEMFLWSYSI
ncbi:hypothetical protein LguiA_010196 [Lonicera macranthoides]